MRYQPLAVMTWLVAVAASAAPSQVGRTTARLRGRLASQRSALTVTAKAMQGIEFPTTTRTLVGKAQPDECFVAIDDPGNVYPATMPCAEGKVPKVNQAYAWSMVEANGNIWFGTVPNTLCLVLGGLLGITAPVQTSSFVCELTGGNPLDDFRPPQIWLHRPVAGTLENKTPSSPPASLLIATTLGLRAAGAHDNVVLIAGPRISPGAGLNMFAFDATTRAFLSAGTVGGAPASPTADYTVYTDIRSFLVVNDELYAGVRYEVRDDATGSALARGGKVLRWTGNSASPFTFVEVGDLDTEAAYLAYHEGRIFASTWPVVDPGTGSPVLAGLWMSPDLGADGVLGTGDDSGSWAKVWQVDAYEPDPVTAMTYAGGALASFDGYLFWGTMHVPFLATRAHFQYYDAYYDANPPDEAAIVEAMLGTQRTATIFRGSSFSTSPSVELLYGYPALPVFDGAGNWSLVSNNMGGALGLWGLAGFGNPFNNYTWAMQVHGGRLWVGTMDWSFLLYDLGQTLLEMLLGEGFELPPLDPLLQEFIDCITSGVDVATIFGGDLYYFPAGDKPAFPESISGIGNYTSYGIRSLASAPSGLYAGMANPMNLLTDTADDKPEGGWEVLRLADRPFNTQPGSDVLVTLDDGTRVTLCEVEEAGYTVGAWIPTPCCEPFIPVPPFYQAPKRVLLLGTSAVLGGECEGEGASVCISAPLHGRLYQLLLSGDGSLQWVDITTGEGNGQVCGAVQTGSQDLMRALGYQGYLGIVALLEGAEPIPLTSPWMLAAFALLVALTGTALIARRLGKDEESDAAPAPADGSQHPELGGALGDTRAHGVGDPERGDHQRDQGEVGGEALDHGELLERANVRRGGARRNPRQRPCNLGDHPVHVVRLLEAQEHDVGLIAEVEDPLPRREVDHRGVVHQAVARRRGRELLL